MPSKVWAVGEEVLAADFNTYVQQQVVSIFPNVTARDGAVGMADGSLAVTTDTGTVWRRAGGVWVDAAPVGVLVVGKLTSNSAAITTETTIGQLSGLTFTADPARQYRISLVMQANMTTAADRAIIQLKDGTTVIQSVSAYPAILNNPVAVSPFTVVTGWTGAHTINTTVQRFAGTGTLTVVAGATTPALVVVEDIGAL